MGWQGQQSSRKGAGQGAQVWDGEWHFPLGRSFPQLAGHPGGASGSMQLLFQPKFGDQDLGVSSTASVWTGASRECVLKTCLWDSSPGAPGVEGKARGPLRDRRDLGDHSAPARGPRTVGAWLASGTSQALKRQRRLT